MHTAEIKAEKDVYSWKSQRRIYTAEIKAGKDVYAEIKAGKDVYSWNKGREGCI